MISLEKTKHNCSHQHKKLLELEQKNNLLLRENKDLRSVFDVATDEFNNLRNELSLLKEKYNDAINDISDLKKENIFFKKHFI